MITNNHFELHNIQLYTYILAYFRLFLTFVFRTLHYCKDCGRQFIGVTYKGWHSDLIQKVLLMLVRGFGRCGHL